VDRFFQFSLLGLVASGYLAVAGSGYLDTATLVLTAVGLLLRGLLVAGVLRFELSDQTATILAISYVAFFGIDYAFVSRDFLTATVRLVFFLAVTKVLTARTNRDYLYTAAIAFLELVAAAILSVDLSFFLFLGLYLAFAIGALTSGEIRRSIERSAVPARGDSPQLYPRLASLSLFVTAGILAVTGLLFFLLPRTADAAFAHLITHRVFLPGFSNRVTLGDIGEIKITSRPIMHIGIFSQERSQPVKWRAAALIEFDGKRWSNPDPREEPTIMDGGHAELQAAGPFRTGRRLNYHVQLNAVDTDALFFAGTPVRLDLRPGLGPATVFRNQTGAYRLSHPPPSGFGYDAYSILENPPENTPAPVPAPILPAADRVQNLQLPHLDPRIPELARSFTLGALTDLERARALEGRLRRDYSYTLELPSREVADPLSYFLFTRRKGYCEYFASAMTVMLRTLQIPARLATGFQSGVYNPLSDLWLVRASDAHTWVEAWLPDRGWTTFDPTPPDPNPPGLALLSRLSLYVDAAQTFWQDWVVSYDIHRQGTLSYRLEQGASRFGIGWFDSLGGLRADWPSRTMLWLRRYGVYLALSLIAAALVGILGPGVIRMARLRRGVNRVRRGAASPGDATLLYGRMLDILKRRGYQKPVWFTPSEFAASLPPSGLGLAVSEFTTAYNEWRFGGRTDAAPRLSSLLEKLESDSVFPTTPAPALPARQAGRR
jgi:transglutaminase-like putative cysteine protease